MQLHFIGKNIVVTPALKAFATEKFDLLKKRYHTITYAHISFEVEHVTQSVEATLHFNDADLHASAEDKDMYIAIDKLVDKLLVQLAKHKEKSTGGHS